MSQAGIVDVESSNPQIPTSFVTNSGTAIPIANTLEILGTVIAAHSIPLETIGSGNTVTVVSQYGSSSASSIANNAGLSSFNSAYFTVDINGFVTPTGSSVLTFDGDTGTATPSAGVITINGGSTGLTTSASGSTVSLTGILNLAHGGTNANLIASNGGIFYSTASAGAILAGTATARQMLQSGASAAPAWSTATWPATTTINQILYSSSSNVVAGLATANNGVLTTGTSGIPVITQLGSNGQLIIGSASGAPIAATLNAGPGISIANGANSITISANDFAFAYTNVNHAASPYTVLVSDQYISVDCSGGTVSLLFPNAPTANGTWVVKDRTGSSATNNISITTVGGSVTIDGQTTYTIDSNYGSVNMLANATPTYEIY